MYIYVERERERERERKKENRRESERDIQEGSLSLSYDFHSYYVDFLRTLLITLGSLLISCRITLIFFRILLRSFNMCFYEGFHLFPGDVA